MKKLLATVLIGAMLLLPTPALASTDARVNVEKVTFDKLETYIRNYNPQIRSANEQVADIEIPGNETKDKLEQLQRTLRDQLTNIAGKLLSLGGKIPDVGVSLEDLGLSIYPGGSASSGSGSSGTGNGDAGSGGSSGISDEVKDYLIPIYESMFVSTVMNLTNITQQVESFDENVNKAADAKYEAALRVEMSTKQMARAAEQMFVQYHNLSYQIEQLRAQLDQLRKQLRVMELYRELGLTISSSVKELENGIKEMEKALKALTDGQQTIIRQFNIMFNQNYDTELEIGDLPEFDLDLLDEMDFEADYKDAESKSYSVRLEDESYYIEAAKRQFKLEFKNGYDKVFDKLESLELEELKLEKLQKDYEFAKLKYELGLLSELKFSEQQLAYNEQKLKVQLAKNELFLAYRDYQWLKEGVAPASGSMTGQGATSASMTGQGMSSYSASMASY